jgi:phosphoserine phosphatase
MIAGRMTTQTKLLCFDCDSTLSAVEGIDELARMRGPGVFGRVQVMTEGAMSGAIPVEAVFGMRLEIIQPRRDDVDAVGRLYLETVEPSARTAIAGLREAGWTPLIISGGFRQAILPLAAHCGIARVEAVDLDFDPAGAYRGYDSAFPTTRSGGKVEILRRLRAELRPSRVVMVGDAVSDLEVRPVADLVVGFGRYVFRERLKREAGAYITSMAELAGILENLET